MNGLKEVAEAQSLSCRAVLLLGFKSKYGFYFPLSILINLTLSLGGENSLREVTP
jgi:hypothetical protein